MSTLARASLGPHTASPEKVRLADFNYVFRVAARRVRTERALSFAARWAALSIVLSTLWVGLLRFTLIELPEWPVLLPFAALVVALVVYWSRTRVTTGQAARYLDHALGLDERLATLTEIASRRTSGPSRSGAAYLQEMSESALELVEERMARLPRLRVRVALPQVAIATIAAGLLAFAMVTPTPVDIVRIERQKLAQSVNVELQRISDLRADFLARPQVSDTARKALLAELDRLEATLKTPGLDRASLLAAIAATQEKLRQVSPETSAEFDPVIRASQIIQEAAVRDSLWSQAMSTARNDLGRAADASDFLARSFLEEDPEVASPTQNLSPEHADMAKRLQSAAGVAVGSEPELSRQLEETSEAMRSKDLPAASRSFRAVAAKLREIEGRQQTTEAIESALSSLDDGKQNIAETGETRQRKAQVGFRRGSSTGEAATGGSDQTPSAGATPGGTTTADSGNAPGDSSNPRVGQNMPAFGGDQPGNVAGSQPDPQGGSSGQTGDGTSGGSPKPGDGGSQPQPGSSNGTPQPGQSDGKLSGPVTGPGGGVTGGITRVENPEGVGIKQGDGAGLTEGGGPEDTLSVPAEGVSGGGQSGGDQSAQTPGGSTQGEDSGLVSSGGTGDNTSNTGAGTLGTIRTAYTEVIGQYIERANAALERVYIPQDAKEYVRDYFTLLGK
jgi:hypothetical protein